VTPDHWHALVTVAAARAGKHIYSEKPLALTIREGQAMVQAVRECGVTLQTGTHHRSKADVRFAMELIRNGRIGRLRRVTIDLGPTHRPGPPSTWQPAPIPDGFDYEMWLGPAPWAPYHPDRCLYKFRFFMDYAGGNLTNNGTHMFDLAQWGNGTDRTGPVELIYQGGTFPKDGLFDASSDIAFAARFSNGVEYVCRTRPEVSVDMRFEGTDGWIAYNGSKVTMSPESLWRESIAPGEINLYRSVEHHRNFIDCLLSGREPITPVEVGHRSTSLCHLGNICMQLGRNLKWDPIREEFPGDEQANRLLSRPMRAPWHL
jgi:predicted dehydrogenase